MARLHLVAILLRTPLRASAVRKRCGGSRSSFSRRNCTSRRKSGRWGHGEIIGDSPAFREVLAQVDRVAPTDATVLLTGETGTGKDLLARRLHAHSRHKDRVLIHVNCAALSPTLIEAELFGREKGAYTGSMSRQAGRFELADGSTLFLDEVTELRLHLRPIPAGHSGRAV